MGSEKQPLKERILFNPAEQVSRDGILKKVPMDLIAPFTRRISGFEYAFFTGGAKFRNGDTLLARITPCLENGKTAFVDILDEDEVAFGSTEFIVMRPKEGLCDNKFVYYLSISPFLRDIAIKSMVGSTGRQRVQQNVLENTLFYFPDLPTQRSIAATLSCLDDKIELNTRIIANLEAQAQAIFKSWFVDFEPFQDGEFDDSELGMIPKGWRVGTLEELVDIRYGKDHKKLGDGSIPVYGSGGIMRFADESIYANESVLIPRKGTLSNVLYVTGQFWTVDTMFYTIMKKSNIAKFVYQFVRSLDLASMNSGSAVPSMTTNILNAIKLVIPKDEIFEDFETVVSPMYTAMKQLEVQNKKLSQTRDALLPKLMSGEVEVPVEGER